MVWRLRWLISWSQVCSFAHGPCSLTRKYYIWKLNRKCILLRGATTVINVTWPPLDEQRGKVPFKCHSVVKSQWETEKCIWKLVCWLVHTHTHTYTQGEGGGLGLSLLRHWLLPFNASPVTTRQEQNEVDHLQAPHLAWSLSGCLLIWLSTDKAMSPHSSHQTCGAPWLNRTEDCKLGPGAKILESLRDQKE